MVICLEQGADLHMAQLMPLPLTVSYFSKFQIGFTFLVLAHLGCPRQRAVKWMCVFVEESTDLIFTHSDKVTQNYACFLPVCKTVWRKYVFFAAVNRRQR